MNKNVWLHQCSPTLTQTITLIFLAFLLFPMLANATTPSWLGVWEGTIGKQTVMVCLNQADERSAYFYETHKLEIELSKKESEWAEYDNGGITGIWTLADSLEDKLEGHWQSPKSLRILPIRLKKLAATDSTDACKSRVYLSRLHEVSSAPISQNNKGIPGLENVRDIAAADDKTCAVLGDGNVKCWWIDEFKKEMVFDDKHRNDIDAIAFLGYKKSETLCMVSRDKTVSCNGSSLGNVKFDNPDHSGSVAVVISPSSEFVCVLTGDGRVRCAGDNQYGQLGDGTTTSSQTPVFVKGLNDAKSIAVGFNKSCAILRTGHVKCWGYDFLSGKVIQPSEVSGISNAKYLAIENSPRKTHNGNVCVLLQDGTAKCWGKNDQGELGNGYGNTVDSALPVNVLGLTGAIALLPLTGAIPLFDPSGNTCALLRTGGVKCWGPFFNDATDHGSEAQFEIPGYVDAVALASGGGDLCSIDRNKTAWCGSVFEYPNTFGDVSKVEGLTDVIKLAGGSHMCALLGNGRVRCWSTTTKNGVRQNLKSVIFDGER